MKPVLEMEKVSVLRRRVPVLQGISLEVSPGETVAVLGPNGAGKSTLLDTLRAELPVSEGRLAVRGRVASGLQSGGLARRTARANVELALAWWGVARTDRSRRAISALQALGAGHLADRPVHRLSGGERRRVHLARAIAVQAEVLLLDEPFAGLDVASRAALVQDAAGALRDAATALVVVVHDRAEAWAIADRWVILLEGRIAADGRPQDLLRQPPSAHVARFLGYTGELATTDGLLLARPGDVQLSTDGLVAEVMGRLRTEQGVLLDVQTERGGLQLIVPDPGPAVGERVHVQVHGGVRIGASS